MEWLLPIGLVLVACVGLHFFMMRGMHGQAGHGGAHDTHGDQPATGAAEAERFRQLESEVSSLREQIAVSRKGSNGSDPASPTSESTGRRSDS